jgi:hypothetical protein
MLPGRPAVTSNGEATISTKTNKPTTQAKIAQIVAGIAAHLASMATIQLNGTQYTPAQLTAIYTAFAAAVTATMNAHQALAQAVIAESATLASTARVTRALRSFLLGYFGEEAVTVLGDFGFTAPKSTAGSKTAATKALAAAKATATKKARGVRGSVQKLDVTGGVTSAVLTATGAGANIAPGTPAEAGPSEPATGSAAPAAAPAPASPAKAPAAS